MPEGDSIYRLARRLASGMQSQVVTGYYCREPALERSDVVGRRVLDARAQGKNLLLRFSEDLALHCHLEMNGSWRVVAVDPDDASSWLRKLRGRAPVELCLALRLESTIAQCFSTRRLRWIDERKLPQADPLRRLGPDLAIPEFDSALALDNLRGVGELPIGEALLRQDLLAGLGNVYKSEVLFICGVNPFKAVEALGTEELGRVLHTATRLLRRNLGRGVRQTRFSARGGPALWVYRRAGEQCLRCAERIQMRRQGPKLRSTYYCARCQGVVKVGSTPT